MFSVSFYKRAYKTVSILSADRLQAAYRELLHFQASRNLGNNFEDTYTVHVYIHERYTFHHVVKRAFNTIVFSIKVKIQAFIL